MVLSPTPTHFYLAVARRMGESNLRRRRHARILFDGAKCIYCGDVAYTIEHMPPAILFRYKHRPNGLEFPSCQACNSATSHADLVAAFFTRLSDHLEVNDRLLAEAAGITMAIRNNIPGFFEEIGKPSPEGINALHEINKVSPGFVVPGQFIFNLQGPIARRNLGMFCAKVGFALYYETTGSVVPPEGGVTGTWKGNLETKLVGIPDEFWAAFGKKGHTLSQGVKKVSDQFEYYVHLYDSDGSLGMYMARLLDGITIFSFAASRREVIAKAPDTFGWKIFSPGDFRATPTT